MLKISQITLLATSQHVLYIFKLQFGEQHFENSIHNIFQIENSFLIALMNKALFPKNEKLKTFLFPRATK